MTPARMRAGDRPLKVAVIGLGEFGERHLGAYLNRLDVEVVGVADRSEVRCRDISSRYSIRRWEQCAEQLLADTEPDAISVATPEDQHLPVALFALKLGISVLLEKPIATSSGQAKRLFLAAEKSPAIVLAGHILRFAAPYQELKFAVEQGAIGKPLALTARRDRPRRIGDAYQRVHPVMLTMIHDIDQVLWLLGDAITTVRATQVRLAGDDQPRFVTATLESADGAVATLSTALLHPDSSPVTTSDRLEIYGTEGTAYVDLSVPDLVVQGRCLVAPDYLLAPEHARGALDAEIGYFCDSVRRREPCAVMPLDQAVASVSIAEAAIRSAEGGGSLQRPRRLV